MIFRVPPPRVRTSVRSVVVLLRLGGFHDFLRAETSRADANPLDAAVNRRPDGLKVRLEPPRAHIVRMADLPTHHRSLPANLATLGHQGTFIYDASGPTPTRRHSLRCTSASS